MIPDTITTLILAGNFAAIMRQCLGLLDELNPADKGAAFRQNVNLRGHVEAAYQSQTFAPSALEPVPAACIAGAVYDLLSQGRSVATIQTIPYADLLHIGADLGMKIGAYKPLSLPSFDINPSEVHITGNLRPKNERVGDADQPAPSSGHVEEKHG